MSDITYVCGVCGKQVKQEKGKPAPLCCRKEMEPLPYCTKASDAEMSRLTDEDGPCDDGITKK
ncbi:MAG: hypothetical protein A2Y86_02415 [Candidatus Aminicenantes bacterium RBG_13_62_12]|nr:MAG: hypothetical protein A2Y86_02415 [Candidatus Aminicenantes bacterium RBG_13_62_12]